MGVRRKLIGIVGALVFALAGTFLVLNSKGDKADEALVREQVPMLVATQALSAGTTVDKLIGTAGMVQVSMVNVEEKNVDALAAVADLDQFKGRVLSADLAIGAPLLTTSFVDRGSLSLAAGGVEVPSDMLQMSFSLDPQRVLGGSLRAGDRIAVVMSNSVTDATGAPVNQTHIVVQKALVANVQLSNLANADDTSTAEGGAVMGNYMVTLALSAPDIERVTNAIEFGRIWLAKQPETADGSNSKVWDANATMTDPVTAYAAPAA